MSSSKSVNKAARSAEKKRLRNRAVRSSVRTYITEAEKLTRAGKPEAAREATIVAISSVDRAVKKKVIHRNKGARLKSRLMRSLNAVSAK